MINTTSWVDVDLDKISNNIKEIKNYIGKTRLLAVVKANAYGHGLYPVAKTATESGADYLGVSSIEEGIFLRQKGISHPILIFNNILPEQAEEILKYDLTATVCSFDVVQALNEAALDMNKNAVVHLKIDTGLGRFGVLPEQAVEMVRIITRNFKKLHLEGIYTHFSQAESERITRNQFKKFTEVLEKLSKQGYKIPIRHVCNSKATLKYPNMHLDMVRVGNLMYGLCDTDKLDIKDPLKIYSKIIMIKNLPKGYYVGYGNKFKTRRSTTIAIVPFGYFDGLELLIFQPNSLLDCIKSFVKQILILFGIVGDSRKVFINGRKCKILGKISMQNCIIDITDIKDQVMVGDPVEINARRTNLSQSLLRIYHENGKIFVESENNFLEDDYKERRREISIG